MTDKRITLSEAFESIAQNVITLVKHVHTISERIKCLFSHVEILQITELRHNREIAELRAEIESLKERMSNELSKLRAALDRTERERRDLEQELANRPTRASYDALHRDYMRLRESSGLIDLP